MMSEPRDARAREILINGRFLTAPQSGVQRVARELTIALDRLLATRNGSERWRLLHAPGAPVPPLTAIAAQAVPGSGGTLWEQTALWRAARGRCLVNLANTAPLMHGQNIVMMHDAQVFDTPSSYPRAFRLWYRLMQPLAARRARKLLTVSGFSAQRLAAHGIGQPGEATAIWNGLDHILRISPDREAIARLGLRPQRYALAFAAAQPHKNLALLLRAWRDPRLADLTLALVGTALPEGETAPVNVRLLGRLDDAALRALYADCLVFLFPSTTEGFGLPPGEAMLCGAPAAVSRAGAMPEVYEGAAEMLPPDDPAPWVDTVVALAEDPARRDALVAAGHARAATLTWERAAAQLLAALHDKGVVPGDG